MNEDQNQNRNYLIVGLTSVFLALLAIFATLLFVGLILGFCIYPLVWPKIKTRLPQLTKPSRQEKLIVEIERLNNEIKKLKEQKPNASPN